MNDFSGCRRAVLFLAVGLWVVGDGAVRGDEPATRPAAEGQAGGKAEYTEPFGGKEGEARLVRLIEETLPPTTRSSGETATQPAQGRPVRFPVISRRQFVDGNMSVNESEIIQVHCANRGLDEALSRLEPAVICRELERQMEGEPNPVVKLYLAALAGRAGSRVAAMHLLETMKSTEYGTVPNVHGALYIVLRGYKTDPPDWIVELAMAALADGRLVTGSEKAGWSRETSFTVSYLADEDAELTWALGWLKCRKAVPLLIGMVKRTGRRGPLYALGEIGDDRAIPVVMDVLRETAGTVEIGMAGLWPELFEQAARAAGQLKAKAAVPVLLEHLCHKAVIEALEMIGDPAAVPELEKLVATGKPQQIEGSNEENDRACVATAKIALVTLKEKDPVPGYCALLTDPTFGEFQRREVVWRLGTHPDPRAVPHLTKAIKSDPSGAVVNQAITVLGDFKYRAAVEGLIECFDAKFEGKADWKRAYRPEMFRQNIAESLQKITGKEIGPDKRAWSEWWRNDREWGVERGE